MSKKEQLHSKIARFPTAPGIYLMKNENQQVVYVGKAKSLRARVRSYFHKGRSEDRLITRRINEVHDIECLVTQTEKEAFILENNFIKQFRPKYNVLFRDDKSFVSIKIPANEPYPRPVLTRNVKDKKSKYFGPYANARAARETLDLLNDIFPLRKCKLSRYNASQRPCLYGQMGKCLAPCCKNVPEKEYDELLKEFELLLNGKTHRLLSKMRSDMQKAAAELDFEIAAKLRDRIKAVEETVEKQHARSSDDKIDRDVFGIHSTEKKLWLAVLFIRNGCMRDAANYSLPIELDTTGAMLESFINQFYHAGRFIPNEILMPVEISKADLISEILTEKKGRKVTVLNPKRGTKKEIVNMANLNAAQSEAVKTKAEERKRLEIESLQSSLGLQELPVNIECFDISNLNGHEAVGSMVVFRNAEPEKKSYRRYKIRDIQGQDDFGMMREVISRRYKHLASPDTLKNENPLNIIPDLIVIDGGKGQLEAALEALSSIDAPFRDIVALAKARVAGGRQIMRERVFLPGAKNPIILEEHTHAFNLITRIRDEAHRFAVSYHRKLRRKNFFESPLTNIPGIGRQKEAAIMDHFKSIERIRKASTAELMQVKGISEVLARNIKKHLGKSQH